MHTQRHAIITGAGRGIGAAIAGRLAAEGMRLTLLGRGLEQLNAQVEAIRSAHGVDVVCYSVDVTSSEKVADVFARIAREHGAPDVLINNAGAAGSTPFHRLTDAHWRQMQSVNLDGVFHCCREALPMMVEAGFGRVVNIASTAGLKGYPYVAAYCAAKHGVVGLTRALAVEYARKNVTVNAVCPGFAETDMTVETVRNIVEKTGRSEEQARAELARGNPQGRLVRPEEVADAVAWLVRPEAAAVTGQSVVVAGGEVM
ncbi:MAG: SDR family NAD(P)-dependent oxidoreductase [Aquisalimonadaceae bacterium]